MTEEKKTTRVAARRKSPAKKAVSASTPELKPVQNLSAATVEADGQPKAKPRTKGSKAKSLQVSIEEVIRLRAYEIYLQRGATPGNPHEDWHVAEREVRAHYGIEAEA